MPTTDTPLLLKDPGFLLWTPLGSPMPTNTVVGSKFTDAWPTAWIGLGPTEEGSEFSNETSLEPVTVAEFFDAVSWDVTEMQSSITFALASWTAANLRRALNGGSLTTTGATTTTLTTLEPPTPAQITRCMIGWESLDSTVRLVGRQCINGGTVSSSFKKAPDKALIPFALNFEKPIGAQPWVLWTAGVARAGV